MKQKRVKRNHEGLQGLTYGAMSSVIIISAIIAGLSVVENRLLLFLCILITGVGDALADAAGFHVSEETEIYHRPREVWKSTFFVFISKIIVVAILLTPVLLLDLSYAILTSFVLAAILIILISFLVCRVNKSFKVWKLSLEYIFYAIVVVLISYGLGRLVTHFIA
jgi:VIT1/CCC1 family predicted Fe2+/Mn2+ transporter